MKTERFSSILATRSSLSCTRYPAASLLHTQVVDTNGSGHGELAGLLAQLGVDTLICGGIGGGAQAALAEANIRLIGGVQGNADEAVQAFLNGTLAFDPNVHCTHHDHGEGHSCGSHGCGGHCHE